ncbi:HD-GYP domain-containing protein [Metabacillus indicus]|uniref:HD-GYP domain-containing protein n=1 Tax=Metabacillus indicus TaxID=246786 RepID=A0A084GNE6_METID|nr:HD domain-containing phosphohydrolase [Metabacillus indicus]KEZ48858.1 hypothetical protein GS18_0215670 [Metabacillus indicus]KEZ49186.1 hypothetical protein AZ46_0214020 [Metabacillus indicus LMG 22858]
MRVHINQINEGNILLKDVLSASGKPLMRKHTVLKRELIDVLHAFLIETVDIESFSETEQDKNVPADKSVTPFGAVYHAAVQGFKKLYADWHSGASVDISKVRNLLIPAVEHILQHPSEVFKTTGYTGEEDYLYHQSVSAALLSASLAKSSGFPHGDVIQIAMTGLLCDCGLTKLDQGFIQKKRALTAKEFDEIKQHPVHSYKMLKNIVSLKEAVKIGVLQHHERMDGSGYPLGTKGDQLHPYGKIAALAHAYQAMVSTRPYRHRQSPFLVLEQLMEDEFGRFDLSALKALRKGLLTFSSGTFIRLSDGRTAEIVFIEDQQPARPLVKLQDSGEMIALKEYRQLYIEEIL